jgi:sugar phosphate isomerase/epimerase
MRDFSRGHEAMSVNTATLRAQWSLAEIIEGCARHGITAISPWRDQVAAYGLGQTVAHLRDAGITLSGYCRGGMFTATDKTQRALARDDNRRALDEAAALGSPCLVLVVGGLACHADQSFDKDLAGARRQVEDGIADIFDYARSLAMPLAIEPLHPMYAADRACINTLSQALDLCDRLDPMRSGALGVAVDVYHVWWDPMLAASILRAQKPRLLAFHVSDWLVPTRDVLNDRGMMGDGVIDIARIRGMVEDAGFCGYCEVEIFSELNWWRRPADEVLEVAIARHKTVV